MTLKKACAYVRWSTSPQDTSFEIQERCLKEFAQREGYSIDPWYVDEALSGSRHMRKRVNWFKLLSESKTAEWEAVLIFNRSRFSRLDMMQVAFAKQTLREAGKKLHAIEEGMADWESPIGRMVDAMLDEAAHDYIIKSSKAVTEGKLNAFQKSGHHSKQCPYGMARRVTDSDGNTHTITRTGNFRRPKGWKQEYIPGDPEEVGAVQWVFQTYATKDVGLMWLAAQLNDKGIKSPDGLRWAANCVRRMLRNPTYVGDTRLGQTGSGAFYRIEGDKVVKVRSGAPQETREGQVKRDTHKGIIDRALWDMVQEKLKRRTMQIKQTSRDDGGYALKGVLFCGRCGRPMYGRRNCHSNQSGIVGYVCGNHLRFGNKSGCRGWVIDERDILPVIIDKLTQAIDARLLEIYSVKEPSSQQQTAKERLEMLMRQREQLDRKIRAKREEWFNCEKEKAKTAMAEALEEKQAELEALDERIKQAQQPVPQLQDTLREWSEFFAASKANVIRVQTSPVEGAKIEDGQEFTPSSFRDVLHRYRCRVLCWWTQRTAKRWDVDRVRIQLGVEERQTAPQTETRTPVHVSVWGTAFDLEFTGNELFPDNGVREATRIIVDMKAKGSTHQQIADALNGQGVKTYHGHDWDTVAVNNALRGKRALFGEVEDMFPDRINRERLCVMLDMKANGSTHEQIAEFLNQQQWKTARGLPWNADRVQNALRAGRGSLGDDGEPR